MVVIVDDTGHVLTLRSDAVVAATVMWASCPSLGPACMGKVRFYARVKQPIVLFADPLL
jgi:hypothetical protein